MNNLEINYFTIHKCFQLIYNSFICDNTEIVFYLSIVPGGANLNFKIK